jgi:hypothetical protein
MNIRTHSNGDVEDDLSSQHLHRVISLLPAIDRGTQWLHIRR